MISGIDAVYYIMFTYLEEIKGIHDIINLHLLHEDAAAIIIEYLWLPLPTIENIGDVVEFSV